jgi:hypothetical protein
LLIIDGVNRRSSMGRALELDTKNRIVSGFMFSLFCGRGSGGMCVAAPLFVLLIP